jgi:DNA-binding GntR family transcriptional regulator
LTRKLTSQDLDSARHLGPEQALPAIEAIARLTRHEISAQVSDPALSFLFHVAEGTALIAVERTAYDPRGEPISFSRHLFLAALYKFETTF